MAKILSSSSTPQSAYAVEHVHKPPVTISSLSSTVSVESKSVQPCSYKCSSLIVTSSCTTSAVPVCTTNAFVSNSTVKVTATPTQQQALNVEVSKIASNETNTCKRPRSADEVDDTSTDIAAKRLKRSNLDVIAPSTGLTSDIVEREVSGAINIKGNKIMATIDSSKLVNGIQSERKSEPKTRRKSSSRSKKKVGVPSALTHSSFTAVCCLCHKKDSELNLGFLFGPYKCTTDNAPSCTGSSSNIWIHEGCAVWTPGVCLVGPQLIGLQEAISDAEKLVCVIL